MTKTLDKPATKPATAKAKTLFIEEAGKGRGVLGNPRWQTPPSLPSRERCQRDVTREEREDGEAIIAEFREMEEVGRANDLGARHNALDTRNVYSTLTHVDRQRIQREIAECDHAKFEAAQHALNVLRGEAAELAVKILTRLVVSFNEELNEVTLAAEARLTEAGIPLSNPDKTDWTLWHSVECDYRHSFREVTRHKLQQFSHSSAEISVGAVQWLCTSEEGVPFQWMG